LVAENHQKRWKAARLFEHPQNRPLSQHSYLSDSSSVKSDPWRPWLWHALCIMGRHEQLLSCERKLQRQDGCRKPSPQWWRAGREVCDEIPKIHGIAWTSSVCPDGQGECASASWRGNRSRPRRCGNWACAGMRLRLLPVCSLCLRALRILGP
jgi:hypothetical protein